MEAWKFIDFSNNLTVSPTFAYSLTTKQWGLNSFPGNLIASSNYIDQAVPVNSSRFRIDAWDLPYDCSSNLSRYQESSNPSNHFQKYQPVVASFCSTPCAESGCLILIEGIGHTRTGPRHSSIVSVTHVISFLFSFCLSIAIVMGLFSLIKGKKAPLGPRLDGYNPPPQRKRPYPESSERQARSTKDIIECADLLREMYAMDLQIWGLRHAVDQRKRDDYMRRAKALFIEIRGRIQAWRHMDMRWSAEELRQIQEMSDLLDQHAGTRYPV